MEDELKKIHEHYRKNYYSEEIDDRIKDGVQQNIRNADVIQPEKKQRHSIAKKISYITAACLVLFGLFIGSSFVSPAMAEVASKIPFLNKIFNQEPIYQVLTEELEDKGYDISGLSYSTQDKTYSVTVGGSEEYYNQVREEIQKVTEDIVSSRGYNDFKVVVEKDDPANDLEYPEDFDLLFDALEEVLPKLQQKGYKVLGNYGMGHSSPYAKEIMLTLAIEDTEKRTDEIERAIIEGAKKQNIKRDVTINFQPISDQKWEIESEWASNVIPVILEGMLNKKEYKTNLVTHSYEKDTMNIFVTTTIDMSDNEAPELANKIELTIQEFLESDELKDIVGDTPFKVVVRDKYSRSIN
ncbi:DUF4179 domain-containing protein [Oceanobacillus polygoni]|uniref:DUF4179 domain-containing protein n=1 Tax=Oceanobacillus polygoni TaxID=1235259 RepID=A0A9X0YX00_9BACI|nr:DUF4179 domain-containing protein [Oceanobacillus polygoni]MBP2080182.1 hypothetical protein [Oceanobacillus polygoni]